MNNFQSGSYEPETKPAYDSLVTTKIPLYSFPVEVGALLRTGFRAAISLCKARGYYIESVEHKSFLSSTFIIKCDKRAYDYLREFERLNS